MRGTTRVPLAWVLYISVLVIATCGLVYELVAGALASYLLGDSVTQFSLIIGTYLSAMGVGAYVSKFIDRALLARFVEIEVAVALIGGFEAPVLFGAFAYTDAFRPLLYAMVVSVGVLVGLELPLLLRILEQHSSLKDLVARVLFLDYIGALVASLLFPLILVPRFGLFRTSLLFGIANAAVALWTTFLFDSSGPVRTRLRLMSMAALTALVGAFAVAGRVEVAMEQDLFADSIVYREATPYQRIVVTHSGEDTRLFLNGALQFSSIDEYRYHESLVHPVMSSRPHAKRVLILGGGDGMAVREVLRWPVESVTLVDLDPAMTRLFKRDAGMAALNQGALSDERVTVANADAFVWLQQPGVEPFDVVIVDFPDPNNYGLGKLYSTSFFRLLRAKLAEGGAVSMQATSPMYSPNAYWCIVETMEHEGFGVAPYHAYIPAFGEWGFTLAAVGDAPLPGVLPDGLKYLDQRTMPTLFHFPRDMARPDDVPVNRLDNQVLVRLYEQDWKAMLGR